MPASSRTEPLLAKAKPIRDGSNTSGITYLRSIYTQRKKEREYVSGTTLQTPRKTEVNGIEPIFKSIGNYKDIREDIFDPLFLVLMSSNALCLLQQVTAVNLLTPKPEQSKGLNNPNSLRLSPQERRSSSQITFVALLWICSNRIALCVVFTIKSHLIFGDNEQTAVHKHNMYNEAN
ncbi:hypothetical protein BTVI_75512 [Pitangus sulphuratus]|nr:hypothetical protein BTVI_75512 [Pitangus sulphuratus]